MGVVSAITRPVIYFISVNGWGDLVKASVRAGDVKCTSGSRHCQWFSSWYASATGTPAFSRLRRARTIAAGDMLFFGLSS